MFFFTDLQTDQQPNFCNQRTAQSQPSKIKKLSAILLQKSLLDTHHQCILIASLQDKVIAQPQGNICCKVYIIYI